MEIDKEDVCQAIVLMDTFNRSFSPISKYKQMAFLSVAGVPLIEYALQSLAMGGITETILYCCNESTKIKEYLKDSKGLWKHTMDVQVKSSDSCRSVGDVMREIDSLSLAKGDFILLGINTITNIDYAALLEQHKQIIKRDKGAAMTLVYKELAEDHALVKSDKSIFLAAEAKTKKILVHQKCKAKPNRDKIPLPTKYLISFAETQLYHNLADPNIAVCSPSVPPLFSDNFDFQTRDDFIRGLLIQEDILTDSLYYSFVKSNKYAAAVSNWKTYTIICQDILQNWVYPLSIESGLNKDFVYLGKHIYRNKTATLSSSCRLVEDVLIGGETILGDNTSVSKSFIGNNVIIGNNVTIEKSYIMDNTVIKDNVKINNSFIDEECIIHENCTIDGSTLSIKLKVDQEKKLNGIILEKVDSENEVKPESEIATEWENESAVSREEENIALNTETYCESESYYSSDDCTEYTSVAGESIPDDTNMFLNEVIDSLTRGFDDKLKCDNLILEINSSRYAYNINLSEVNFYVVQALLSLPHILKADSCLVALKEVISFFRPIFENYIKTKSSIRECLKAVEDTCIDSERLRENSGHLLLMLYNADIIDDDSLLEFNEELKKTDSPLLKVASVIKFFVWLKEADEESESD